MGKIAGKVHVHDTPPNPVQYKAGTIFRCECSDTFVLKSHTRLGKYWESYDGKYEYASEKSRRV